ncbi:L,D-transpeptidase [Streptomyces sp. H27-D2]|uniref:L,D-transpeptidase n=1 Tax=Streptomyces sp. H27-D2 TaxID=3046304 RepID=UPI002DBBC343|nr:Ig-like domain-containing protein [Streptomyces sp. H27-D2]MEC4021000.1 Ig-like domain-containing protein [Streptomyces sp. H27-D2]
MTNSKRRKGLVAAAALLGGVLTLAACGGSDDGDANRSQSQAEVDKAAAKDSSDARIKIAPRDGTSNAGINSDAKVTVSDGKLSVVKMTAVTSGAAVKGTISPDGKSWKPDAQLERSSKYKLTATAKDKDGRKVTANSAFSTVSPSDSFIGNFTPEDGSTVGVGMPVSINFDKPITDKKAVESAINVNSTSGQKVVGHWFSPQRLDFRPAEYWKAESTVTMKMKLDGVEGASGVTGVQDKNVTFKVGHAQVSTVDANTHKMTVVRDGKTIKTIPISAGSSENPTYNGKMVIAEKFKQTRMDGATVGFKGGDGKGEYDIPDVPHAMRLSASGTFIHGNYWGSDSIFGSANTSHGCIGLNDAKGAGDPNMDGAWFFDNSQTGDVVVMKGSPDKTIAPDNGLSDWNMDWNTWTQGSALNG